MTFSSSYKKEKSYNSIASPPNSSIFSIAEAENLGAEILKVLVIFPLAKTLSYPKSVTSITIASPSLDATPFSTKLSACSSK